MRVHIAAEECQSAEYRFDQDQRATIDDRIRELIMEREESVEVKVAGNEWMLTVEVEKEKYGGISERIVPLNFLKEPAQI
uniref:Uncharacterized protein n=1 Tax=Gibberella zeae TaxID=5518 RepID=A0A4E9DG80_GIBZA